VTTLNRLALLALVAISCDRPSPAPNQTSGAERAASSDVAASAKPSGSVGLPEPTTDDSSQGTERTPISEVLVREGALSGKLGDSAATPVRIILSTKHSPLAYGPPVAFHRVAERIQPGLTPLTQLRVFTLAALSQAALDDATRRHLENNARVLADGTVRAAVVHLPPTPLRRVDVADLTQGGVAWSWESKLVSRQSVDSDAASMLASYQALLMVDYVLGNLARRYALLNEKQKRLVAVQDNDVFTPRGVEGAVSDGLVRLSRFMTYPAAIAERLSGLDRDTVAQLLRSRGENLVTPKQVDEIISRKQSIQRLIETRIKQRGKAKALALP
jgi:hypothetical protein